MARQYGRIYVPDSRDTNYPLQQLLESRPDCETRTRQNWDDDNWLGNQGNKPYCVGYAWSHWLETGPIIHDVCSPAAMPDEIYFEAQKVDEWPGERYAGTSVRAGAKILKRMGFIASYYWASKLHEIINALLYAGPIVLGTNWYSRMSKPNKWGVMRARGGLQGGHAYLATGVDIKRHRIRIRNSWGTKWGRAGRGFLRFSDVKRLLKQQGEACLAVEISKKSQLPLPAGCAVPEHSPAPVLPDMASPIPEKPDDDCSPEPE